MLLITIILASLAVWSGCGQKQAESEIVIMAVGGTTPEDAYRKYSDYLQGGSYREAFSLLSAASRQIYDRAAINLMQIRGDIGKVPDPQERLYFEQLFSKLNGNTGEDLFITLMVISTPVETPAAVSLGAVTSMGETSAEATTSNGMRVEFTKEPDGLWRIELPKAQLEASLGALELRVNAIKSGTALPAPAVSEEVSPEVKSAETTKSEKSAATSPVKPKETPGSKTK